VVSKVTTLDHEILDRTVELRALVVQRNVAYLALVADCQRAEVCSSQRDDIVKKLEEWVDI